MIFKSFVPFVTLSLFLYKKRDKRAFNQNCLNIRYVYLIMAIVLANKVLVAPVGIYQQRVWKSIVRSGADKIYLISDSKPEYSITKTIADTLEKEITTKLMAEVLQKEADFSKLEDIYRVFIGIIERERAENPDVKMILDVTSTTKEATIIASNLASPYKITISYVPGKGKISKEIVEKRYQLEKDDLGGEIQEILPALSMPEGSALSKEEAKVLYKIAKKHYESFNELIEELSEEEGIHSVSDAYKKRLLRTAQDLEGKRLIKSEERGRVKLVELTEEGKGIVKGLIEANEELKKERLKPLLELLYV